MLLSMRPALAVLALVILANPGHAQGVPGINANVVGPTPPSEGNFTFNELVPDKGLKQQNEPSCAVQPGKPKNIFCGYNDYRGTDYPQIGDSWLGASMSRDGGLTWISRLGPGYPGDPVAPGPIGPQFGADPTVVAVPGLVLYNFIAACREGACPGGLYVQRWYEHNRENGPPWSPLDRIEVKTGTSGRFIDKPGMEAAIAAPGSAPDVAVTIPAENGGTQQIQVPAGRLHLVYSVFTGNDNNLGTQIWHITSDNWGANWNKPQKLNESVDINQGAAVATKNNGRDVITVWRRFSDNNESNAIMYAYSGDAGQTWSKPLILSTLCGFDQPTGPAQFRTNALPTVATDDKNFYVFFAARAVNPGTACKNPDGTLAVTDFSRIYMAATDFVAKGKQSPSWSTPAPVDPFVNPSTGVPFARHQFMPAASSAGGVVQVAWYDNRYDDRFGANNVFLRDIVDSDHSYRRTLDVMGAQIKNSAVVDAAPADPHTVAVRISKYPVGIYPYFEDDSANAGQLLQLEANYANARLFGKGTRPFIGDYITVAAPSARTNATGAWESNAGVPSAGTPFQEPTFVVAWADNRNVRGLVYYTGCDESVEPNSCGNTYTPTRPSLEGEPDESPLAQCVPADPRALARNQNVYAAPVEPGLALTVASAAKPPVDLTDPTRALQRSFVVYLRNSTGQTKTYQLSIQQPPPSGVVASFVKDASSEQTYPLTSILVSIPKRSGAARTVFVTGPEDAAPVLVSAQESGGGAKAVVALNANPLNQRLENQRLENSDVSSVPVTSEEVYNLDLGTREVQTFLAEGYYSNLQNTVLLEGLEYDPLLYQRLENDSLLYYDIENQRLENQRLENQRLENQRLENQRLENQRLENQRLENTAEYVEISWELQSQTNTTSGYNVQPALLPSADVEGTQLFITRSYQVETAVLDPTNPDVCQVKRVVENQVVYNEIDPVLSGNIANPGLSPTAATVYLEPGDDAIVTLRVFGKPGFDFNDKRAGLAVYSQSRPDVENPCEIVEDPSGGAVYDCDVDFEPDLTPPTLDGVPTDPVPGTPFQLAPDNQTYRYQWGPVTASDEIDGSVGVSCTPGTLDSSQPPFTFAYDFPLGTTTVSCEAVDASGNRTTAQFTVQVTDVTGPVVTISAPAEGAQFDATSAQGAGVQITVAATDAVDGTILQSQINCSIDGFNTLIAAPFFATFPIGTSELVCRASDAAGNTGTTASPVSVLVRDTGPSISVLQDPLEVSTIGTTATVTPADLAANVQGTDVVDGTPEVSCVLGTSNTPISSPYDFPLDDTQVECTASDSIGQTASASFIVRVAYAYLFKLIVPKNNIRAGSTVPLDWQYLDTGTRLPIDSSSIAPSIRWQGPFSGKNCGGTSADTGSGQDAGSSNFRYSRMDRLWQYSWQTPSIPGSYRVTISPPGTSASSACITLAR